MCIEKCTHEWTIASEFCVLWNGHNDVQTAASASATTAKRISWLRHQPLLLPTMWTMMLPSNELVLCVRAREHTSHIEDVHAQHGKLIYENIIRQCPQVAVLDGWLAGIVSTTCNTPADDEGQWQNVQMCAAPMPEHREENTKQNRWTHNHCMYRAYIAFRNDTISFGLWWHTLGRSACLGKKRMNRICDIKFVCGALFHQRSLRIV